MIRVLVVIMAGSQPTADDPLTPSLTRLANYTQSRWLGATQDPTTLPTETVALQRWNLTPLRIRPALSKSHAPSHVHLLQMTMSHTTITQSDTGDKHSSCEALSQANEAANRISLCGKCLYGTISD